jgi:uncharacterized protein
MAHGGDSGLQVDSSATTLEILTRDECLVLLATVPVGRLGVNIGALPAVLPVNFAFVHGKIIIRTSEGSKLDAAVHNAVVAFEVDSYDPWGAWGWSVLVQGSAAEITDADQLETMERHPLRAWAFGDRQPGRYLGIGITMLSGRRFGKPPEWAAATATTA